MSEQDVKLTTVRDMAKKKPPISAIKAHTVRGLPLDLWMTRVLCLGLTIAWTVLLIAAAALEENSWYLLAVGTIGMVQNAIVAGVHRRPEKRGIHLENVHREETGKAMDVQVDIGRRLCEEFFPGKLKDFEVDWWNGNTKAYDNARLNDRSMNRGIPWNQGPRKSQATS
jgi:hypothetical protein